MSTYRVSTEHSPVSPFFARWEFDSRRLLLTPFLCCSVELKKKHDANVLYAVWFRKVSENHPTSAMSVENHWFSFTFQTDGKTGILELFHPILLIYSAQLSLWDEKLYRIKTHVQWFGVWLHISGLPSYVFLAPTWCCNKWFQPKRINKALLTIYLRLSWTIFFLHSV